MARYQYEPFPYVTPPELAGDGATGAPVAPSPASSGGVT